MLYPLSGDIPDHPTIRNMERTGYPDGKYPVEQQCPICGSDGWWKLYKDKYGEIVGCDDCITEVYCIDEER